MRISSIKLTNIKGYRGETAFDNLGHGIILILGRNGCGKSTLAQAVGLTMFGTRPEAFKGKGTSINGFISQGCSEASIEVIAHMQPGRTLIYQAQLKAPSPDDLSPRNLVTIQVFNASERDDPDRTNLAAGQTLEDIAQFTKEELGLRLKPQELFARLLAPVQAGGLTEYLKKTPAKRKEQTEEILGLAPVRALAKSVRKLKSDQKKLQQELLDELTLVLEQTGETYSAFVQLKEDHARSKPAFDTLEQLHVLQCAALAQSSLMPSLIEASRALVMAQADTAQARKARVGLEEIAEELQRIDRTRQELNAATQEVVRLEKEAKKAADGQEMGRAYDAQEAEASKVQEALNAAEKTLSQSKVRCATLEAKKQALTEKLNKQQAEMESLEKASSTFEARRKECENEVEASQKALDRSADALKTAQDKVRQLDLLREVMDAIHGMDLERLQRNIGALRDEASQHLLPEEAQPLVADLERNITPDFVAGSNADPGLMAQILTWEANARTETQALQQAHENKRHQLEQARQAAQSLKQEAETSTKRLAELQQGLSAEQSELAKLTSESQAAQKESIEHQRLRDQEHALLAELKKALGEEGRREAWLSWKASVEAAKGLDAAVATRALKKEATQALVMKNDRLEPLGLAYPALEDADGWQYLAQEIEARRQQASERIEDSLARQNEASTNRLQEAQRFTHLEAQEREILRRLAKLRDARAAEKEFAVLAEGVLARLPSIVASSLVSRVSQLADEFFQSLFSQAGADLQMVWDPSDYEVTLRRGASNQPARFASGGEQMAMGIALNLAVLHYMAPQTRWLVLDEPTASLDTVNRAALRDFVEQLSTGVSHEGRRLFDQLFFISHESRLFEGLGQMLNFDDRGDG